MEVSAVFLRDEIGNQQPSPALLALLGEDTEHNYKPLPTSPFVGEEYGPLPPCGHPPLT